jgi:protein-S-isoprenylcysteine O-methyltransferase Ste14
VSTRGRHYAASAVLVALFSLFAWANFRSWLHNGRPSGLGATALEAYAAMLFLVRRQEADTSTRWLAWVAAPLGTFTMLLSRPTPSGFSRPVCEALQLVGAAIALASLTALGRSFGLVAADRGLKTGGLYRLVRHPAYSGYLLSWTGYVAENPSPRNVLLLVITAGFLLVRISEEERHLSAADAYRRYRDQVRFRLLPFVY